MLFFNIALLVETARANYSQATELHQEALSVARQADDKNIVQLAFFGLAIVAVFEEGIRTRGAAVGSFGPCEKSATWLSLRPVPLRATKTP